MDIPTNILGTYRMENGNLEIEFYWVTPDFINVMESMMRNFVAFQHPQLGGRRLAILSLMVYWDHNPQRIMELYGGPPYIVPSGCLYRNMDVTCREAT